MAERGVEAPAAEALMTPGDRVVGAHRAPLVAGLVHGEQHADARPGIVPERVPLIASGPGRAEMFSGRVVPIRDGDHAGLHRRVLIEPGTDQVAEPGPAVFGGRRAVDAEPRAARRHVSGERLPARLIEHLATGGQEHNRRVVPQYPRAEHGGIFGRVDGVAVQAAERANAGRDGRMPVSGGARVDKQAGHQRRASSLPSRGMVLSRRMTSPDTGMMRGRAGRVSLSTRLAAISPIRLSGNRTVVSGGDTSRRVGMSSKPATAISEGTDIPSARSRANAPTAITSFTAKTQSGGLLRAASSALIAQYPPSRVNAPSITQSGLRSTDQAFSPARNPSTRSRAVSRSRGPARTAKLRCPRATRARAKAAAPPAFSGLIVSTPSRSCPTQATRPPEATNAATSARSASRAAASSDRLPMRTTARARCARISATYSRSSRSADDVREMQTRNCRASVASINPAAIEEKYGSSMSRTMSPIMQAGQLATILHRRLQL